MKVKITTTWTEEVSDDDLIELCENQLDIEDTPTDDEMDEAFQWWKNDREDTLQGVSEHEIKVIFEVIP